jgi:hypothetical protein
MSFVGQRGRVLNKIYSNSLTVYVDVIVEDFAYENCS